jgi:hypothetical protein
MMVVFILPQCESQTSSSRPLVLCEVSVSSPIDKGKEGINRESKDKFKNNYIELHKIYVYFNFHIKMLHDLLD